MVKKGEEKKRKLVLVEFKSIQNNAMKYNSNPFKTTQHITPHHTSI